MGAQQQTCGQEVSMDGCSSGGRMQAVPLSTCGVYVGQYL